MNAVIELTTATRVLVQLRAKAAVKDAIRRQGHKPSSLTAAEIRGWADLYVEDHPALVEVAREQARAMILEGLLGNCVRLVASGSMQRSRAAQRLTVPRWQKQLLRWPMVTA